MRPESGKIMPAGDFDLELEFSSNSKI